MPTTRIPEGVEVELLIDGDWIEYSGKRSWSDKKRIRVNRLWVVKKDGKVIGAIRYVMITREQRTPGRRYVNSRWESPGFESWSCDEAPRSIYDGPIYRREAFSKSDAIESILWNAR